MASCEHIQKDIVQWVAHDEAYRPVTSWKSSEGESFAKLEHGEELETTGHAVSEIGWIQALIAMKDNAWLERWGESEGLPAFLIGPAMRCLLWSLLRDNIIAVDLSRATSTFDKQKEFSQFYLIEYYTS